MSYIRSFKINKLFGFRNVEINHQDDCIILVGENGTGKSTIMNCLYYLLTLNFSELSKIPFESLEIVFYTGKKFVLKHNDIVSKESIRISIFVRRFVNYLSEQLEIGDLRTLYEIFEKYDSYHHQLKLILQLLNEKNISHEHYTSRMIYNSFKSIYQDTKSLEFDEKLKQMNEYLLPAEQIFHLTTYRRVEASLSDVDSEIDEQSLIVYGMDDVRKMLTSLQNEISDRNKIGFNNMMISMLDKLFLKREHKETYNLNIEKVKIVLLRLGSKLSNELRDSIIKYCKSNEKQNNELDFFIEELIKLYEQQEDLDNSIVQFCDRCNKYLRGKKFEYDVESVNVLVRSEYTGEVIGLDLLSSGEKQMVGLMAKMYLSKEKAFIVLIDEPELSLSITWQQHILEDMMDSGKIKYMMAVTHSPFIYDNSLQKYAVGMSNFITDL